MAATIEKVSSIHEDIAWSILSKLPIKSLKRFECVCKSWSRLFENPYFMSMYRNNFISNHSSLCHDATLMLNLVSMSTDDDYDDDEGLNEFYSVSESEGFAKRIKLDWPNPIQIEDVSYVEVYSSCSINGILCLLERFGELVVLWNPTTKEFKVIPPSPYESYHESVHFDGFGYDSVSDDYKVIRHVELNHSKSHPHRIVTLWEMYSVRSNSWRMLDVDMPGSWGRGDYTQVYTDGMCHWLCEDSEHNFHKAYLVSFDLSNEVFFNTPISLGKGDSFDVGVTQRDLVVLNGSIGLISYYKPRTTFHISILGELGVKESWTKLFTVGPLPWVKHFIGFGKKGEMFLTRKNGKLVLFDLGTQMVEELGIKGLKHGGHEMVIYKESHLPIGGIDNLILHKAYQVVPDVKLKIEGVRDVEEAAAALAKDEKAGKKKIKKGRIPEIKYMEDIMSEDGDDHDEVDGDDNDDIENGEKGSGGLVSKKREKGIKAKSKKKTVDSSELGSVKPLKESAKRKKKDVDDDNDGDDHENGEKGSGGLVSKKKKKGIKVKTKKGDLNELLKTKMENLSELGSVKPLKESAKRKKKDGLSAIAVEEVLIKKKKVDGKVKTKKSKKAA